MVKTKTARIGDELLIGIGMLSRKTGDWLEKITIVPLAIIGGTMVTVVLVGTFYRYVLNASLQWTEEAARYLMIWMALVGASVSMNRREHIGIRLVIERLPLVLRKIVELVTKLLTLYFLYVLSSQGVTMVLDARTQVSPGLGISMFWPLLSVPVAGILMMCQLTFQIIVDLTIKEE